MTKYRIIELRPDVFSVEEYGAIAWFLPWIKDWMAHGRVCCEYSSNPVAEFTRDEADQHVAKLKAVDELVRIRKNPPKGYPRVVDGEG